VLHSQIILAVHLTFCYK